MADIRAAYKEANALRIARLKREESERKEAKKARQIEDCYRRYVPPQILGFPELCKSDSFPGLSKQNYLAMGKSRRNG